MKIYSIYLLWLTLLSMIPSRPIHVVANRKFSFLFTAESSLTWWTWVWVNSGSWWWTGRPGMLRFMGSQRVGHDWVTELNWTEYSIVYIYHSFLNHSSANGHVHCFHVLAIVNSAVMNTEEHVSFSSVFLSVYGQQWDCWVAWQFYFQFFKESPQCSP